MTDTMHSLPEDLKFLIGLAHKNQRLTSLVLKDMSKELNDITRKITELENQIAELHGRADETKSNMESLAQESSEHYEHTMKKAISDIGLTWPCKVKLHFTDSKPSHIEEILTEATSAVDSEPPADTVKTDNPEE